MVSTRADHAPILHAEDNEDDVLFMKWAFEKADLHNPLIAVHDGGDAIDYLAGIGQYADRSRFPLPCLVITDLKMPRANGFDLLRWLKAQDHLRNIPAIVLSSSGEAGDRRRAQDLGAADFWVKPAQLDGLVVLVREMRDTWVAAHCS